MARSIEDIERDITRSRKQLAETLDTIAQRSKPSSVLDGAKKQITEKLNDPKIRNIAAGTAAAVAGIIIVSVAIRRRQTRELRELKALLSA